ncbi:MAG: Cof-type HAD-IIB family hydrolase [Cyclobacteriaceae bacterium]|nr:HAD family hydrolase [Cyclobacteriaceae bacterium]MCH8515003.1 Cof-type HAD-IIB family hydrolase [Cyclobacteriaceae bacterium]
MENNIKVICSDIDGTLLDKDRKISAKTKAVFQALNKDFLVVLSSSRMPSAMTHLQEDLGIMEHPMICYNGGFILPHPNQDHKPISSTIIDKETAEKIFDACRSSSIHLSFYHEDNWWVPAMDQWTAHEMMTTKVEPSGQINPQLLTQTNGFHKVMCMGDAKEIEMVYNQLTASIGNEVHLYRSKSTYIEIAPKSISKSSSLKQLLTNYGHKMSEVVAFGDNYNDIEMLKDVGIGVAVANAKDEVKKIADEITDSNKEDGVANFLMKNFL